ncbi:hypothetical protein F4814DRAFT_32973 [Daldinia grandis]|nr:hypothetical protein F4814DRAFT_32973 [Daldinia grandis]
MSPSLAIRCTGRTIPRLLPGSRTLRLRPLQRTSPRGWQLSKTPYFPHGRHLSSLPPTGEPQTAQQQQQQQPPKQRPTWRTWALFNLAGLSGVFIVAVVLKSINAADGARNAPMNTTSFSPFTITAKEQVSPTAFVLSVRADQSGGDGPSSSSSPLLLLLRRPWDHGLWSVEVKQPQLQIARHYTPLPPLSEGEEGNVLRFLIRKVEGGEMSTYLSKLRVGEKVWLRGPHLGFDVARRLGDTGRHVVFLAGGTGIAPALQVARRVLEDDGSGEGNGREKPTVSILWANRYAADALGRQQQQQQQQSPQGSDTSNGQSSSSSSWLWRSATPTPVPTPSNTTNQHPQTQTDSTLALQIRSLQLKHPSHFHISYYIDEERHFIEEQDLRLALTPSSSSSSSSSPSPSPSPPSPSCPWHSATQLPALPNDNDAARQAAPCTCLRATAQKTGAGAGADLVCVSGPDGFVAAYAGAKRWFGGTERQGPVRGVLGQMMQDGGGKAEGGLGRNWLVLKL